MPPGTLPKKGNSANIFIIRTKGQWHLNYLSPSSRRCTTSLKKKARQWRRMQKTAFSLNESITKTYNNQLRN